MLSMNIVGKGIAMSEMDDIKELYVSKEEAKDPFILLKKLNLAIRLYREESQKRTFNLDKNYACITALNAIKAAYPHVYNECVTRELEIEICKLPGE